MDLFEPQSAPAKPSAAPVPLSEIDLALTAQLVVAWAGEAGDGDERRLGWWRSDLVSEFGGEDFFRRLLPATWRWAVLKAARETARRKDNELRASHHNPDQLLSLFSLGFHTDELLAGRLAALERSGVRPEEALPGLVMMAPPFRRPAFEEWCEEWLAGRGSAEVAASPSGRRIAGAPPAALEMQVRKLVAALAPLGESYPLPHFRRSP
jgi:hypothetical protein